MWHFGIYYAHTKLLLSFRRNKMGKFTRELRHVRILRIVKLSKGYVIVNGSVVFPPIMLTRNIRPNWRTYNFYSGSTTETDIDRAVMKRTANCRTSKGSGFLSRKRNLLGPGISFLTWHYILNGKNQYMRRDHISTIFVITWGRGSL